jgi:hypothetical protein
VIRILIADHRDVVQTGFGSFSRASPTSTSSVSSRRRRNCAPDPRATTRHRHDGHSDAPPRRHRRNPRSPHRPNTTQVVILTTFDLDEYVFAALAAGASGFLLKDVKAAALADAIRTVHAGEALLVPSATKRLIERFIAQQPTVHLFTDSSRLAEFDAGTSSRLWGHVTRFLHQ